MNFLRKGSHLLSLSLLHTPPHTPTHTHDEGPQSGAEQSSGNPSSFSPDKTGQDGLNQLFPLLGTLFASSPNALGFKVVYFFTPKLVDHVIHSSAMRDAVDNE